MKLTHKLAGTALLAAIALAATAPGATKAADPENPGVGEGEIEFTSKTYGTYDSSVIPPNYTSQSTIDTDSTALLDGPFLVQGMSKLVFKAQTATTGAVTSWALPTTANPAGTSDHVKDRANWVQFKDDRQVDDHRYTLSAQISQNFQFNDTAKGKVRNITGAQITYGNAHLVADKDNEKLKPSSGIVPAAVVNETATANVFVNSENTKGRGRYAVYFGDAQDPAKSSAESVQLDIPADQADEIMSGKYVAKIKWTLTAAE